MKFVSILFTVTIVCALTTCAYSEDEAPKRAGLLLRRPNPRSNPLAKSSTTTAAPERPEILDDEEYDIIDDLDDAEKDGGEPSATTTTTTTSTEPPKKIGPIIRPFRSNDDLLLALKRRQMNVKKGVNKIEKPKPKIDIEKSDNEDDAPPAPTAAGKSTGAIAGRRRFGGHKPANAADSEAPSAPGDEQPTGPAKRPASRFNARTARSNN